MGDYYGRQGDIKNSIAAFEKARQLRPRYADATHNLGNTYLQIDEATKAAQLFKEALKYNPTLYQSHRSLGQIALSLKQYKTAIKHFTKSAELNSDPFTEYLLLYVTYRSIDSPNAKSALAQAIKLAKNNPQRLQLVRQVQKDKQ